MGQRGSPRHKGCPLPAPPAPASWGPHWDAPGIQHGMLQGSSTGMLQGPCTGMLWDAALGCSGDPAPDRSGDPALGCSGTLCSHPACLQAPSSPTPAAATWKQQPTVPASSPALSSCSPSAPQTGQTGPASCPWHGVAVRAPGCGPARALPRARERCCVGRSCPGDGASDVCSAPQGTSPGQGGPGWVGEPTLAGLSIISLASLS